MPRFVILEHDHPVLHWDLMLEADGVLQTWRLAGAPEFGRVIEAMALGDHRIAYLDYEGPVSGNRGSVKRWDAGDFDDTNPERKRGDTCIPSLALGVSDAEGRTRNHYEPVVRVLFMRGAKILGGVRLEQIDGTHWRFVWEGEKEPRTQ